VGERDGLVVRAGLGRADITPKIGVELAGFGPFRTRRSSTVFEPIYARALAVEAATARWVLVSCDLVAVSASLTSRVRQLVEAETGWSGAEIAVHATHTHSAPSVQEFIGWGEKDPMYLELAPNRIADACIQAISDLAPASFRHAEVAAAGFSYNRMLPSPGRTNKAALAGEWITAQPELTDTTAHVLRIDREGSLVGFVAYYSCHPVICCERNTEVHGDFVGVAVNRIERMYPGTTGLFLQGAEGDLNTIYHQGPRTESLRALNLFADRFASVIKHGIDQSVTVPIDRVGALLRDVPYALDPVGLDVLEARYAELTQKLRAVAPSAHTTQDRLNAVFTQSLRRTIETIESGGTVKRPVVVHGLRLGPISLIATNLEVFHGIKRRFQARFGRFALVLSVTNDYLGYAPTADAFHPPLPGYPAYEVPYFIGHLPFTSAFEGELLAGMTDVAYALGA
jgi:hypothetical protein